LARPWPTKPLAPVINTFMAISVTFEKLIGEILVKQIEQRELLGQGKGKQRGAGGNGDVLLAIYGVGHRSGIHLAAERGFP